MPNIWKSSACLMIWGNSSMNTWMPTAALTNKRNVPNSSNAPTPLRIRSKGTSMATACKKWIFLITITEAVTLSSLEKYARRRDPQIIQHNYIPTSLLSFKDAKQSKLLFSLFFTEFLVWMLSKIFSGKKNNIYNSIKLFLSKKKIAHLYTKLLLYYLKLYVKKLEVRTVRQISFFLHIRWRIATTGKNWVRSQFFLFLNYWKQNKKQKLYLLKNDILLSDLLRYYHRLKQTNVKKQTNTKKLNKCTTLTTKNCDTYMCANFCYETPLPHWPSLTTLLSNFLFKKKLNS